MNKKQIWIKAFVLLYLCMILNHTVLAANDAGRLDSVSGNTVSGWAWDSDLPDHTPTVTIQVNKAGTSETVYETNVSASEPRNDLITAGKGENYHGFTAYIDWSTLAAGTYQVQAIIDQQYPTNILYYRHGEAAQTDTEAFVSLGSFKTTAYCPCRSCSGRWGRRTSTGATALASHTVAVDPKVIPYGTKLMINGVIYTAEDRGGGVKGRHIDIFFNTHSETVQHGVRQLEVFVIP